MSGEAQNKAGWTPTLLSCCADGVEHWTSTVDSYLDPATSGLILEAAREGVSASDAESAARFATTEAESTQSSEIAASKREGGGA